MPVYHSEFNEQKDWATTCNAAILPLKTKTKGIAPPCPADKRDIVDEAIRYFRANVMFRNFELEGTPDRVLVYLTVYIAQVIRELVRSPNRSAAEKAVFMYTKNNFDVPGDKGFPMPGFFTAPQSRGEADQFRTYFKQVREEAANRMLEHLYNEDGSKNKFWFQFAKRKFMNIDRGLSARGGACTT